MKAPVEFHRTLIRAAAAVLCVALVSASALVGVLLWLTPYQYVGEGRVRVHRYTGRTEVLNLRALRSGPALGEPVWIAREP
jgi:hypothetical protein